MADSNDPIFLTQGKITAADYLRGSGGSHVRYVIIHEVRYFNNRKLMGHKVGDYVVIAYRKKDLQILASWNKTQQQGSSAGLLGLIFPVNVMVWIVVAAVMAYEVKAQIMDNPDSAYKQYLPFIWGALAGITVLAYFVSFFGWRAKRMAQKMVDEHKDNKGK